MEAGSASLGPRVKHLTWKATWLRRRLHLKRLALLAPGSWVDARLAPCWPAGVHPSAIPACVPPHHLFKRCAGCWHGAHQAAGVAPTWLLAWRLEGCWCGCLPGSRLGAVLVERLARRLGGVQMLACTPGGGQGGSLQGGWLGAVQAAGKVACRRRVRHAVRRQARCTCGGQADRLVGVGTRACLGAASSHLQEGSEQLAKKTCMRGASCSLVVQQRVSPQHPQHPNQKLGWRLASRSGLECIATAWASRREAQSVARAGGDKRPAWNPMQRPAPFQLSFQGNLNWRALAAPGRMLPRPLVRRLAWRRDREGLDGVLVARLAGAVEGRLAAAWAPGQVGGTRPGWVLSR